MKLVRHIPDEDDGGWLEDETVRRFRYEDTGYGVIVAVAALFDIAVRLDGDVVGVGTPHETVLRTIFEDHSCGDGCRYEWRELNGDGTWNYDYGTLDVEKKVAVLIEILDLPGIMADDAGERSVPSRRTRA